MKKEQVIEELRTEMLKHAERAEWFTGHKEHRLATYERLMHRAYWEAIENVKRAKDKSVAITNFDALEYLHGGAVDGLMKKGLVALAENEQILSEGFYHARFIVSEKWD